MISVGGRGWLEVMAISQNINYPKLVLGGLHHINKQTIKKLRRKNPFGSSIQNVQNGFIVYFYGHHNVIQSLGNPVYLTDKFKISNYWELGQY